MFRVTVKLLRQTAETFILGQLKDELMTLEKTVSAVTMTCWENEEADKNIACYQNYLQLLLLLLTIFNWCRKKNIWKSI